MLGWVDRGSILLVVYAAFSAAVVEGLWQTVSRGELLLLAAACIAMLGVVLVFTLLLGRLLGLSREDAIVLQFCGSKKSLATRSEEHTSELQSLMRISYAVFCLQKTNTQN